MTTIINPGRHDMLVLQIKQRLKLEKATGLRAHSSCPKATTLARTRLGLHGKPDSLIEQVDAMWENILAVRKYTGAGLYNCCKDFKPPNWTDFDWFEVQPLMWIPEHDCLEPIVDDSEAHLVQFWTVYGHLHEGGVECITDCHTMKQAMAVADMFVSKHGETMAVAGAIRESREAPKH
jgi:hypothetical protein